MADEGVFTGEGGTVQISGSMPGVPPPKGVFAEWPGATPKYARNRGLVNDDFVNTMARMFVPVSEYNKALFEKFTDTTTQTLSRVITGTIPNNGSGDSTSGGPGYVDFLLQNVQHAFQERSQIVELLADDHVDYFFGQGAPIFNYSGTLINTKQDDQAINMFRLYRDILRGFELAKRNTLVMLSYDDLIVSGAIMNLNFSMNAEMEMAVPFSFSLVVKKIITKPNPDYGVVSDLTPFATGKYAIEGLAAIVGTSTAPTKAEVKSDPKPAASPSQGSTPFPDLSDPKAFMAGQAAPAEVAPTIPNLSNPTAFVAGTVYPLRAPTPVPLAPTE